MEIKNNYESLDHQLKCSKWVKKPLISDGEYNSDIECDCILSENKKLREYAQHKDDCFKITMRELPLNIPIQIKDSYCTCGLEDLLKDN